MGNLGELNEVFRARSTREFGEVVKGYTYFANGDILCAKITPLLRKREAGRARNLENGVGFGSSEFVVMRSKGEILPDFFTTTFLEMHSRAWKTVMSGAVGHKLVTKRIL